MIFWTRPKQRQGQFVENDASRVVTKPPRRRADFTVKCYTTMIALRTGLFNNLALPTAI